MCNQKCDVIVRYGGYKYILTSYSIFITNSIINLATINNFKKKKLMKKRSFRAKLDSFIESSKGYAML